LGGVRGARPCREPCRAAEAIVNARDRDARPSAHVLMTEDETLATIHAACALPLREWEAPARDAAETDPPPAL
jgi:hypothetical protein